MPGTKARQSKCDGRGFLERIVAQTMDAALKDINKIRFAFEAKKSARFEDFSAVFRELKASMLFQGHATEMNAKIFVEDIYELLLLEFEDTEVIVSKIFIVYMLYASYYTHTCRPRVPIRLRDGDFERLEAFVNVCREDNHFDIIYAIRRLHADSAFHYVHSLRSYGFKSYVLDPQHATHRKLRLDNKIASHRYLLVSTDLFRRLSFVHDKYCELKTALNVRAEEEALDRENPFENMQKTVSVVSSVGQQANEDAQTDADDLPDDDEEKEDMNDVDFENMAVSMS